MLRIHNIRRPRITNEELLTVALVGERDRRAVMKHRLRGKAIVVAELESGSKIHLLDELLPDMVIIDVQSSNVNPAEAVALANELLPRPQVVLVGADVPAALAA